MFLLGGDDWSAVEDGVGGYDDLLCPEVLRSRQGCRRVEGDAQLGGAAGGLQDNGVKREI